MRTAAQAVVAGALALVLAGPALAQDGPAPAPSPATPLAASPTAADGGQPAPVDATLVKLEHDLGLLLAGTLPPDISVDSLFTVRLDDLRAVTERLATVRVEADQLAAAARFEALEASTRRALEGARIRERIARLRVRILDTVHQALNGRPGPAIQALVDLSTPRAALRKRASDLRMLVGPLDGVRVRAKAIADRVASGGLVGFQVQREEATQKALAVSQRARDLGEQITAITSGFEALATDLEVRGRSLRRTILLALIAPDLRPGLDATFIEHLQASRTLSKRATTSEPVEIDPAAIAPEIDSLALSPGALGTCSEAKDIADQALERLERLAASLAGLQAGEGHWQHAFEREAVTVLAALVSPETRRRAYSLSTELWSDLKSDLAVAWGDLQTWAATRWQALLDLPAWAMTSQGSWWLLEFGLAIALLILMALLRRRIAGLALLLVRFARGRSAFRNSLSGLVRWAGLLQAILPTLALLAVGYLAMWLIGLDAPEVAFIEVAFFWLTLYFLGRQTLLGLTRRISRGRPALLPASDETVRLLRVTYGRVGLFMAIVVIAAKWGRGWLGAGTLSMVVQWIAWLWVAGWALWAAFAWRHTMGGALIRRCAQDSAFWRLGGFMQTRWVGALATPVALIYLCGLAVVYGVRKLLTAGGVFTYLRSLSLKRLSRKSADKASETITAALPEEYIKEFPLYPILGEEEASLLPRADLVDTAVERIAQWRPSGKEGSLVLVGEKGSGKTTLMAMLSRAIREIEVVQHTITKKRTSEKGLMAELSPIFGLCEAPTTVGPLAAHLNKGEPKVVMVDEAHNVFLREVDGYQAYDAMVRLVNFTAERVFWVLSFNSFAWDFVNQSRNRLHYFRKLISLESWSAEQLQDLIGSRNKRAGYRIELDPVLLDADRSGSGDVELVETAEGFYRLLREASSGNPRVATHLWLCALMPGDERTLRLGLFRQESSEHLQGLDPELLFALAAICQHENLSVDELRRVLNVTLDFADFAVRFLNDYGYTEPKHTDARRVTLAPRFYPQVLRVLRARHLLFEKE